MACLTSLSLGSTWILLLGHLCHSEQQRGVPSSCEKTKIQRTLAYPDRKQGSKCPMKPDFQMPSWMLQPWLLHRESGREKEQAKYVCRWTLPSVIHVYWGHLDCTKPLEKWDLFSWDVEENTGTFSPALTRQSNHENVKLYYLIRYESLSIYPKLQVSCLGCSAAGHKCSPFPRIS